MPPYREDTMAHHFVHYVAHYNAIECPQEWPMYKDAFAAKHTIVRNAPANGAYPDTYPGATIGYIAKSKADGRWRFAFAGGRGWMGDGLGAGTDLFSALRSGAGYPSAYAALRAAFPLGTWN
jgi:hypothetical protein